MAISWSGLQGMGLLCGGDARREQVSHCIVLAAF